MALIKCPECEKEISDMSELCIHCGYPILKKQEIKKCEKCDFVIADGSDVCSNCGNKLEIEQEKNGELTEENIQEDRQNNQRQEFVESNSSQKTNKGTIIGIVCGILGLIITIFVMISMNRVEMPNLYNVSQSTAETILGSNNLIPSVEYIYDDFVSEGNVVRTSPYAYSKVEKNSVVVVYVSKGPSFIDSQNATIEWYHITNYAKDEWNFRRPYIEEGYLYIECDAVFAKSFNWKGTGTTGFGEASINDSFDKKIPLDIITDNLNVSAKKEHSLTLKMSINDLDVKKTTTLYTKLIAEENGRQFEVFVNFTISW